MMDELMQAEFINAETSISYPHVPMATHLVDRRILAAQAKEISFTNAPLGQALFQMLGLSKGLSQRLLRARAYRKTIPNDETSMKLYHKIIWLSREGLNIVESIIMPHTELGQHGPEMRVFAFKLRASFYHVFCLFHNRPAVSPMNPAYEFTPKQDVPTTLLQDKARGGLREPVISMLSDESANTNPYASSRPGLSPPPGLSTGEPSSIPDPAAFLIPSAHFLPLAIAAFSNATNLATELLPGSSPLRLSVALEHSAFLWDCVHDHDASRRLAKKTVRGVYSAQEGMDDEEFKNAAALVSTLGSMMRRKSNEKTPKMEGASPVSSTKESTHKITRRPVGTGSPTAGTPSPKSPNGGRRSPKKTPSPPGKKVRKNGRSNGKKESSIPRPAKGK